MAPMAENPRMIEKKERRPPADASEAAELKPPTDENDVGTVMDPEVNLRDRSAKSTDEGH